MSRPQSVVTTAGARRFRPADHHAKRRSDFDDMGVGERRVGWGRVVGRGLGSGDNRICPLHRRLMTGPAGLVAGDGALLGVRVGRLPQ